MNKKEDCRRHRRKKDKGKKICIYCKKEFSPSRIDQTVCKSKECQAQRKRDIVRKSRAGAEPKPPAKPRYKKTCPVCGRSFLSHYPIQITCSKKCKLERNRQKNKDRYAPKEKVDVYYNIDVDLSEWTCAGLTLQHAQICPLY